MAHYIYDIRRHVLAAADWDAAEALVALLMQAVDDDAILTVGTPERSCPLPGSVAMFLLDGLLRLCGDEEIVLIVLAAKGRLRISEAASMLDLHKTTLQNRLRDAGLKALRTRDTKPIHYDQEALLDLIRTTEPGPVRNGAG